MSICYINGEYLPTEKCSLPVTDLVIQRGVGVFDSIRIYGGKALAITAHIERLGESARIAGINVKDGEIIRDITRAVREGALRADCPDGGDCIAKAYITGGDLVTRGTFPNPRHFVIFESGPKVKPEEYQNGAALQPTAEGRPYPLVKSINYLVGLMQEAGREDVLECLYCPGGKIMETLKSSFFICRDGRIITAPIGSVLGGVTRNIVLELAREDGFKIEERCPDISELKLADEAFLTSSWKEVLPVVRVGDTKIAGGKPGPVAAHLQKLYRANLDRWLDK
ncbi:MAG: aminotransferase class IV [Synergistaceae bacterium]|jgi:branched-chain amino acid aminotransferase|nr:aminotransferase class IV [Synergistaceae bacterium]